MAQEDHEYLLSAEPLSVDQAQVPISTHSSFPPRTKSHLAKPEIYDGSKEGYKAFKQQFIAYLLANMENFPTDQKKILFIYSFLQKGSAKRWASRFFDKYMAAGQLNLTFVAFIKMLDNQFQDRGAQERAHDSLLTLRQGQQTAQDFFDKFGRLAHEAGYDPAIEAEEPSDLERMLVNLMEKAVNPDLIKNIYQTGNIPERYVSPFG